MKKASDSFEYVLYIDEAGDDGLKSLRPEDPKGSSEWMCLAGYLVRASKTGDLPALLRNIRTEIASTQSSSLHYRKLSPTKRIKACELLATNSARAFAMCSFKRTLKGYDNPRAAMKSQTNQWYYNFLVRMLLERVTDFCAKDSVKNFGELRPVRIVFSSRGGHRYGQMKAYFRQLRHQAIAGTTFLNKREIHPDMLRQDLIEYVPHYMEAGLQFADLVASAVFQSIETNSSSWSIEPAAALRPIFALDRSIPTGKAIAADYSFVLIPEAWKVSLSCEQKKVFELYGYSFKP